MLNCRFLLYCRRLLSAAKAKLQKSIGVDGLRKSINVLCFCTHCQNRKHKNRVFSLNSVLLCQIVNESRWNDHLVTVEPPLIYKMIRTKKGSNPASSRLWCTRFMFTESVTESLPCQNESCSSSSLGWKIMNSTTGISYCLTMSAAIKHITDDILS